MQKSNFCHLHLHTDYSMLDGLGKPVQYVGEAERRGEYALSITDHGTLSGLYEFYMACMKASIKPLLGCEFYFVPNADIIKEEKIGERFHVVVLANNYEGFKTLIELNNEAHRRFYYKPVIDRSVCEALAYEEAENLTVLSGCAGSILSRKAMGEVPGSAAVELQWWRETFPHFYVELQHHNTDFDRKLNSRLLNLASRYKLPWVITNDPHYVTKDQCDYHDALLAIQTAANIDAEERFRFDGNGYHLKTRREMEFAFRRYEQSVWKPGIAQTMEIAKRIDIKVPEWDKKSWHIPKYRKVPKGKTSYAYLRHLTIKGLQDRGFDDDSRYVLQAQKELRDIKSIEGFADFLLITREIIQWAVNNKTPEHPRGIPVGPGRGSTAGCLVAYLIGVHKCDPMRYGLLFERFLNPARPKMPDIDTDFSQRFRHEVMAHIVEEYGTENVLPVAAFQTMKVRGAFRKLATAMGMPFPDLKKFTDIMAEAWGKEGGYEEEEDDEEEEHIRVEHLPDELVEQYPDVVEYIEGIVGTKSAISRHASGIVIFDPKDSIRQCVPEMWVVSSKRFAAAFDLKSAEGMGLMKQDILGLRTLDTIDEAVGLIEKQTGELLDPDSWIPDEEEGDSEVYKMMADGHNGGVFQIEGGCLPLDTPVLTSSGWTPIGLLKVGDHVVDPRGDDSVVEELYLRENDDVYRIDFSDGTWVEATLDHRWEIATAYRGTEVVTTEDIVHMMEQGYVVKMPSLSPPDLHHSKPTTTDPYVLGVYLGDGSSRSREVRICSEDDEILQSVEDRLVHEQQLSHIGGYDYRISGGGKSNGIAKEIRELGLWGLKSDQKFVPENYLWSPATTRLELLRGLMDTDGTIDIQGRMEFTSTSKQLAEDVLFLVHSLGGKARINYRPPNQRTFDHGTSECKETWRVQNIRFASQTTVPFHLSRKASRVRQGRRLKGWNVQSVTKSRTCDVACISVSADSHLYITKDWIVSHNTMATGIIKIKPKKFDDVVVCTSIYRKGPMIAGAPDRYIANKKANQIKVLHPSLKPILGDSYGEMAYQEQLMRISSDVAGFDQGGVADLLAAVRFKDEKMMAPLKDQFIKGCHTVSGIDKDVATRIWSMLEKQSSYLFNKSHAYAYTLLTYQTARLKCWWPLQYLTALMRTVLPENDAKKEKRQGFLAEATDFGFKVLPPDVNLSVDRMTCGTTKRGTQWMRFGFSDIKGIGAPTAQKILDAREAAGGRFKSMQDVRAHMTPGLIKKLDEAGCLDAVGGSNRDLNALEGIVFWQFNDIMAPLRQKYADKVKLPGRGDGRVRLFGEIVSHATKKTKTNKNYMTWRIRWAPSQIFTITMWEDAESMWNTPVGSIVMVEGKYNSEYRNVSVGDPEQIRVLRYASKKKEVA